MKRALSQSPRPFESGTSRAPIPQYNPALLKNELKNVDELDDISSDQEELSSDQEELLQALILVDPQRPEEAEALLGQPRENSRDAYEPVIGLMSLCSANRWSNNFIHLAKLFKTIDWFDGRICSPDESLIATVLQQCKHIVDWEITEFGERDEPPGSTREMEQALRDSSHIRSFSFQIEVCNVGFDAAVLSALQSHHHLQHLAFWAINGEHPESLRALHRGLGTWSDTLQTLDLEFDKCANVNLVEIAESLRQMPALERLELTFLQPRDLSGFVTALTAGGHGLRRLNELKLTHCLGSKQACEGIEQTALALVNAIGCLPNLMEMCVDANVRKAMMGMNDLPAKLKTNGLFSRVRTRDEERGFIPHWTELLRERTEAENQLQKNMTNNAARQKFMVGWKRAATAADPDPFALVIANTALSGCTDVAQHISNLAFGDRTPADLRNCQSVPFVSRELHEKTSRAGTSR